MKTIDKQHIEAELRKWIGEDVFVHCEATSLVFARNFRITVKEALIAGGGSASYRVALRFDERGWLRMEGLTHAEVDTFGRLLLAGFDDRGRMEAALHLSKEAFPE